MSESVYCASPRAIAAAVRAYPENNAGGLADALVAVHHPTLGLDRSVCLRDILTALRRAEHHDGADVIAREFGADLPEEASGV